MKFSGHRLHATAVRRLMPDAVADGRITLSTTVVTIHDPDPVVLLERALDAVQPGWRSEPLAYLHWRARPGVQRPAYMWLLAIRAAACRELGFNPAQA